MTGPGGQLICNRVNGQIAVEVNHWHACNSSKALPGILIRSFVVSQAVPLCVSQYQTWNKTKIGDYSVECLLGDGAYGWVYRCRQPKCELPRIMPWNRNPATCECYLESNTVRVPKLCALYSVAVCTQQGARSPVAMLQTATRGY